MSPLQLFDMCIEAVERWKSDPPEIRSDRPFLLLTVTRPRIPKGERMRVFGKSGPLGRICNVKERGDGNYDITGYWPAAPIMQQLVSAVSDKAIEQAKAKP